MHRYFSIFFFRFSFIFLFFLRFFPIQLKSVGSRKKEEGGHFGTVDPISRLYISVTFFFFFLYFIYFFFFFFYQKENDRREGQKMGRGFFFVCPCCWACSVFVLLIYVCVCYTVRPLVHLRFSFASDARTDNIKTTSVTFTQPILIRPCLYGQMNSISSRIRKIYLTCLCVYICLYFLCITDQLSSF